MSSVSALLTPGIPVLEKLVRTVFVYGALAIGLRLAGKREMSQLNSFDVIVLLLLSNTVQNALIGPDDSLAGGLIGAIALLALNWAVVRVTYRLGKLDALEGAPSVLVHKGRVNHKALTKELITVPELEAAAHRQGIATLAHVETCRLETGGALTFVERQPTDEERRYDAIMRELKELRAAVERGA